MPLRTSLHCTLRWESYLLWSASLLWLILLYWLLQFPWIFFFFFCNVTSLGIVCTRWGKIIFCHFIAFVNYSCEGGSFWVNYFGGIPVLILSLQDVYISYIFVPRWAQHYRFCCNCEISASITCPWGNESWGRSNSFNCFFFLPRPLFPHRGCVSGQTLTPSTSRWKQAVTKVHWLKNKKTFSSLLSSTPEYNANAQKFSSTEVMRLECESEFDPVSPLSQNVEHAKMGRWALKWEDPVYPQGIWLEWNLPSPGNLFAREGDIQAFFFDIFMLNSSTEHLPSTHPCLHLLLGFLCGWLQSHGPSGTPR